MKLIHFLPAIAGLVVTPIMPGMLGTLVSVGIFLWWQGPWGRGVALAVAVNSLAGGALRWLPEMFRPA
jgi:hypothetical protein